MLNNQPGGLQGLIQSFHDKGLGSLVQSWVGTGQNLPITADQISHVLGSDQVKQLASAAGISPDAAGSTLAK
ncbi:YidB family protein, partial [Klebsiella pneumoniae]